MSEHKVEPQPLPLQGARIAVLGYGLAAREHALGLRRSGNAVEIGLRLGGMSWVRARRDEFEVRAASVVVGGADVVVVLVPDDEQASVYWHAIEPELAEGALLVFAHGLALETQTFAPRRNDVVLVTGELGGSRPRCRVAVHHDATGRALERALAYVRAAFGSEATVGTTTVSAEVDAELAALSERLGGMQALLASIERSELRVRDSHAPEEAKVAFYEGMKELVARRMKEGKAVDRGSGTSLVFWQAPGGGRA